MASFFKAGVNAVGLDVVDAKMLKAAPNILAHNRVMVGEMLRFVKAETVANTPVGPGHFGYHLRDSFTTDSRSKGLTTIGVLKSPATGYWREYGTMQRYRKAGPRKAVARLGAYGLGGERAYMTAHHALTGVKKFIAFYYGGMAKWWKL